MAKKFCYVCIGILALVVAYAFGAQKVEAQSGGPVFAGICVWGNATVAIAADGDLYGIADFPRRDGSAATPSIVQWTYGDSSWRYLGNVLTGPVKADAGTLGGVKSLFR